MNQPFNTKTPTLSHVNLFNPFIYKLRQAQNKKKFNLFWNKLTRTDRQRVILLIGIDHKPVPSLTHLKAELALTKYLHGEKWIYGGIE